MDPTLLDCLSLHEIIVDEGKAKAIDASTKRSTQLHDQLTKLRKKGKFKEYREVKDTLLKELKETDALGVDLGSISENNNAIIKQTLAIYFEILKQHTKSPLLRSVFLGLPQFIQYINLEIIWDLIGVLREYFVSQMGGDDNITEELDFDFEGNIPAQATSNILAGLLCVNQVIKVGAGQAFNVEERDFTMALYAVIQRMLTVVQTNMEGVFDTNEDKDFIALLRTLDLTFCQKRALSNDVVNAFVKRLALF